MQLCSSSTTPLPSLPPSLPPFLPPSLPPYIKGIRRVGTPVRRKYFVEKRERENDRLVLEGGREGGWEGGKEGLFGGKAGGRTKKEGVREGGREGGRTSVTPLSDPDLRDPFFVDCWLGSVEGLRKGGREEGRISEWDGRGEGGRAGGREGGKGLLTQSSRHPSREAGKKTTAIPCVGVIDRFRRGKCVRPPEETWLR